LQWLWGSNKTTKPEKEDKPVNDNSDSVTKNQEGNAAASETSPTAKNPDASNTAIVSTTATSPLAANQITANQENIASTTETKKSSSLLQWLWGSNKTTKPEKEDKAVNNNADGVYSYTGTIIPPANMQGRQAMNPAATTIMQTNTQVMNTISINQPATTSPPANNNNQGLATTSSHVINQSAVGGLQANNNQATIPPANNNQADTSPPTNNQGSTGGYQASNDQAAPITSSLNPPANNQGSTGYQAINDQAAAFTSSLGNGNTIATPDEEPDGRFDDAINDAINDLMNDPVPAINQASTAQQVGSQPAALPLTTHTVSNQAGTAQQVGSQPAGLPLTTHTASNQSGAAQQLTMTTSTGTTQSVPVSTNSRNQIAALAGLRGLRRRVR